MKYQSLFLVFQPWYHLNFVINQALIFHAHLTLCMKCLSRYFDSSCFDISCKISPHIVYDMSKQNTGFDEMSKQKTGFHFSCKLSRDSLSEVSKHVS